MQNDPKYKRYSDLVDKKFETGLTKAEEREMKRLYKGFEKEDAKFYERAIKKLEDILK